MPMFNYNEPTINKPSNPLGANIRSQPALAPRDYSQPGKKPYPPFQAGTNRFFRIGIRAAFLLLILILVFGAIQAVMSISNIKRSTATGTVSSVFTAGGNIIGDRVNVRSSPSLNSGETHLEKENHRPNLKTSIHYALSMPLGISSNHTSLYCLPEFCLDRF